VEDVPFSRQDARATFGLSDDAFVVLAYGSLESRKGLDALVKAVAQTAAPPDICVLAVGEQDEFTKRLLNGREASALKQANRLIVVDTFVDAQLEAQAITASDVLWLGYRNHFGMSGVMVLAGQAGRPIISCSNGLIAWMTERYRLGIIADISDQHSILNALSTLRGNPHLASAYAQNGRNKFRSHTSKQFCKVFWDVLEGRLASYVASAGTVR
jgi:glycosyltransferase involved in cell wall biosynthesis